MKAPVKKEEEEKKINRKRNSQIKNLRWLGPQKTNKQTNKKRKKNKNKNKTKKKKKNRVFFFRGLRSRQTRTILNIPGRKFLGDFASLGLYVAPKSWS